MRLQISASRLIAATPAESFRECTAIERMAPYLSGVLSMRMISEPPLRLGSVFSHERCIAGLRIRRIVHIAEWDPPNAFTARFRFWGLTVDSVHEFPPVADGTVFRLSLATTVTGFQIAPAVVLWQMLRPLAQNGLEREVDDFSRHMADLRNAEPVLVEAWAKSA